MNNRHAGPPVRGLGARVSNARLRVGAFAAAGDAVTLTQGDATTCGATAVLAARLLLGAAGEGGTAATAGAAGAASGPASGLTDPADASGTLPGLRLIRALHAEQRRLQARMNRRSGGPLGPLPWSRHLGSTPWAVARALGEELGPAGTANHARTVYRVRWVREGGPRWPDDVLRMRRVLDAGLPAVMLVGGPLMRPRPGDGPGDAGPAGALRRAAAGLTALLVLSALPALPRHYVLALPWRLAGRRDPGPGRAHVYEPSSGSVRVLDLLAPRDPAAPGPRELGYWPRVLALITPDPRERVRKSPPA